MTYLNEDRVMLEYEVPMNEIVVDFYDNSVRILSWDGSYLIKSKSVSSPRAIIILNIAIACL
jgi:translation elongation factor EF-4